MSKTAHNILLTVDRGNTLTKFVVYDDNAVVGSVTARGDDDVSVALDAVMTYRVTDAIGCTVARPLDDMVSALSELLTQPMSTLSPKTVSADYVMTVEYADTLGADRLAAAIGAVGLHPGVNLLVVDAGSAITYDYITLEGRFVGGNIAPGLSMRLKSLHDHTARLPEVKVSDTAPDWGHDTRSAMLAGAVNGAVAELLYYRSLMPADTAVVITGGDADIIAARMPMRVTRYDGLVNYGLMRYHRFLTCHCKI